MQHETLCSKEGLRIRKMETSDLLRIHPYEIEASLKGFVVCQSIESHTQSMRDSDILYVIIEDELRSEIIGYTVLAGIMNPHRSIELRRLVIFETNMGYGRRTMHLLSAFVFSKLNAHRLWLDVRSHNEGAYHLYKSVGYRDEGILRESFYWNEQFIDIRVLSLLKKEFDQG